MQAAVEELLIQYYYSSNEYEIFTGIISSLNLFVNHIICNILMLHISPKIENPKPVKNVKQLLNSVQPFFRSRRGLLPNKIIDEKLTAFIIII